MAWLVGCGTLQAQLVLGPADEFASPAVDEAVIVSPGDTDLALGRLMEMDPVSDASLDSARQALELEVSQLDAFLSTASEKREEAWRDFLGWPALEAQLEKETPSYRPMNLIFERFDSGHPGLYHPKFRSTWRAFRKYNERLKLALASETRAEQTKAVIAREIAACEQLLTADEEAGETVRRKLRWNNISDMADADQLEDISYRDLMRSAGRLANASTEPIDEARFRKLSDLIVSFADYKFLTRSQTMREQYNERITKIAELIAELENVKTNDAAGDLLNELAWLDDLGLAPEFTSSVRSRFRRDNLHVGVSDHVVRETLSQQTTDTDFTRLRFYKTNVCSWSRATVCATPSLVCCDECAVIDLHFCGHSVGNAVGSQNKVHVYNRTFTNLSGSKRLYITADGLCADAACTDGPTKQMLKGICVDKLCGTRLISRLAARKTKKLQSEAEYVGCLIAKYKLARQIDEQVAERLAENNEQLDEQEADLRERGLYPQSIHLSTTCDRLFVNALQVADDNLGAWNDAPALTFSSEVNSKFHQSVVNNLLRNEFGGRYYDQDSIVELIEDAGLAVPEELQKTDGENGENGEEEEERWSITLDKRQPISVTFADGNVSVAVRGRKFTQEGTELDDAMEIVAIYRPTVIDGKVQADRIGDIDVVFPDQEGTLSARQIAYKTFIRRKVGSLFKDRFTDEDLPSGDFEENLDDIRIEHLQIEDNWLCAGVDIDDQALRELSEDEDDEQECKCKRQEVFYWNAQPSRSRCCRRRS